MQNPVIFHCKPYVAPADIQYYTDGEGNLHPIVPQATHTLAFEKFNEDTILVGWSKAHESDCYNKKMGREKALERINHVRNRLENFSNRTVKMFDEITEQHLPSQVIDDSFDYYFQRAASTLLDLDTIAEVKLFFRTTRTHNTVIGTTVSTQDIKDIRAAYWANSIVDAKTVAENDDSKYVFATFSNESGDLFIAVQNRENFYTNGLEMGITDEIISDLDSIVSEENGISANSEDEIILLSEALDELKTIKYLSEKGLAYDFNLETAFTGDEDGE